MKYIWLGLNWILGVFFSILVIVSIFTDPLPAIPLIFVALLFLPPIHKFIESKFGKPIPAKVRLLLILILLMVFGSLVKVSEERKQKKITAEKAEQKRIKEEEFRQKLIEEFNEKKVDIIMAAKEKMKEHHYESLLSITSKYVLVNDSDLNDIISAAKKALKAQQDQVRIQEIIAKLKGVPAKDYKRNLDLYSELVQLSPENEKFIKKRLYYKEKNDQKVKREREAAEKRAKEQKAAAARNEKIQSQFSAWDGSHYNLERIIKNSMNDPDSYQHVQTVYWDMKNYLVVKTTFRGKNAFGGLVLNYVKAKVDLNGNVLEIIEQGP